MRVISGQYRRTVLNTLPGDNTRPTTDRIKETLFNIISEEVNGSTFLDLFAGSGQIGIEALSRYADSVTFIDNNMKATDCINDNLRKCRIEEGYTVICSDVISSLKRFKDNTFDMVFMDPPYGKGLEKEVLYILSDSNIVKNDGLIIVEADLDTDFNYISELHFTDVRDKQYKTNRHLILRKGT